MSMAARMRRVMVLAKRISASDVAEHHLHPQMVGNSQDRHRVHEDTIRVCKGALSSRAAHVKFEMHWRDEVQSPIHDVDLVITVGGDGTLLQASHFVDPSVPVLGVNSDPTQLDEVEENLDHFDASRSSGYLCAATASNFEQMLDGILDGSREPVELTRISTSIDGVRIDAPALNDVLIAHPSPAAISRCSFSIWRQDRGEISVHSRSSGLRICTATGSTAAMKSAGGAPMPLLSPKLQYMAREPYSPHPKYTDFMTGFLEHDQALQIDWRSRRGVVYVDGSHQSYPINFGCKVTVSNQAPPLRIFWGQQ